MSDSFPHQFRHISVTQDNQEILWAGLDMVHSTVNRLSRQMLDELNQLLDYAHQSPPAGVIIYSAKPNSFIVGADIDEFASLDTPEKSKALIQQGWTLFNRLANTPYPTLALIHGHCLGGGLELALACRYRLAVYDQPASKLGLPEVRLGIFPAWGGIQRLPALIGPSAALDMLLTGRTKSARQARRLGLVDASIPQRLAHTAAPKKLLSGDRPQRVRGTERWLNVAALKPLVARQARKTLNKKDPYHHYPAPRNILTLWTQHNGNPLGDDRIIAELTQSPQTRNLIRVYHLQERLKQLGRQLPDDLPQIHVIGAGVMGANIAAWCALKGCRVTLHDTDISRLASAHATANHLFKRRTASSHEQQQRLDNYISDYEGHGVSQADIVIEAIVEDLAAKHALYQSIEPRMKADAILATNTSSLSIMDLAQGLQQPQRFVGLHFFNPVSRMPLVEVIQGPRQSRQQHQKILSFIRAIDKLPLPVKDHPGFLVNAVLAPYMLAAMRAVDEGTTPATIDRALEAFGMPMGPLELADTVGLDIIRDAGRQLGMHHSLPTCLQTHLENNHLGRKTGQGFYTWDNDKAQKGTAATPPDGLAQQLIQALVDATSECVRLGVVADDDLADAGVIFGTGFAPFLGGPLQWQRSHRPDPITAQ